MIAPFKEPVYVTRPFLPPLDEFCKGLEEIWQSRWLTNAGPVLERFQGQLSDYFRTKNLCLFSNGTLALQIGLQGMGISGEVITTPFSFVATTHALYWNKIRPVFADIEPDHYTLDPDSVEAAITPWTTAILAVHVYGFPCMLYRLSDIARQHNLKLIYDSAHAFGVQIGDQPISNFGDMSMFSFHATKLYHSIEGGMLIFRENAYREVFDYLKNFGFQSEVEVVMPGTNAKMNELQALMGSLVLKYMNSIITKRKHIHDIYRSRLEKVEGIRMPSLMNQEIRYNYAFMPIEIYEEQFGMSRDELYEQLARYNIFTRKYFYPIIPDFSCYRHLHLTDQLANARRAASRILTLPVYYDLSFEDVHRICDIVIEIRKRNTVSEYQQTGLTSAPKYLL